jgi:beta-carotene/zeaxanthin 4-ketolase
LRSLLLSGGIASAWLASLLALLRLPLDHLPWWCAVPAVLLRTQLHTGLFIIGHDAMHGTLGPGRPRLNDGVGRVALALYAALPYGRCRRNHQRHHRAPATAGDPDFAATPDAGAVRWYGQFMAGYLSAAQMAGLLGSWAGLVLAFHAANPTAHLNVLLFCTLPLLLSSLQLFIFGTYLPHRQQREPSRQAQPGSLDLPPWLSLLACFHFGYHHEHHTQPQLRWFELPAARARAAKLAVP